MPSTQPSRVEHGVENVATEAGVEHHPHAGAVQGSEDADRPLRRLEVTRPVAFDHRAAERAVRLIDRRVQGRTVKGARN